MEQENVPVVTPYTWVSLEVMVMPPETTLKATRNEKEWMWCLYCERVFREEDLVADWHGEEHSCPYCGSSGIEVDIYPWDSWRRLYPRLLRHWPSSVALLRRGMHLPLRATFAA
jgi:hypothetical protein